MSANARGVPIGWAPIMMVTVAHITPACARGQSLQDDHVPQFVRTGGADSGVAVRRRRRERDRRFGGRWHRSLAERRDAGVRRCHRRRRRKRWFSLDHRRPIENQKRCNGVCVQPTPLNGCTDTACTACPGPPAFGLSTCNPMGDCADYASMLCR